MTPSSSSTLNRRRLSTQLSTEQVKVETRMEMGDPRDVICDVAEKMGVDMVVLGSHGYGLIKRAFLGSVSNHVAQKSNCPVLIVKRPKNSASTTSSSRG
ncbi:hypothetical protein E3N88_06385 [Mikania micrantha]|uniref:UspA domain-containing protein n=1 Tax=Mikania micrantha TaxID=192012 RepID=A0A5N6PRJ6_9ASTR|nr:hypothetical protein E3N88_06385 [Mikania micrantha]